MWLPGDSFIFMSSPPKDVLLCDSSRRCHLCHPDHCALLRALCMNWVNSPLGTAVPISCRPSTQPVNSFGLRASGSITFTLPPRHHDCAQQVTFKESAINKPFFPMKIHNLLFIRCLRLVKMVSLLFLLISIHNNSIFPSANCISHRGYTGFHMSAKELGILGWGVMCEGKVLQISYALVEVNSQ